MSSSVIFSRQALEGLVGGVSPLDMPSLNINDLEQAYQFASVYGYNLQDENELAMVHSLHRRAVALIKDHLLKEGESIPEELAEVSRFNDVAELLIMASRNQQRYAHLQDWACALLKVMHAFSHLDNDIFSMFPEEIKSQILKPFRNHMMADELTQKVALGLKPDSESLILEKFEVKPLKTITSSVIKLLAKREAHSLTLLDKIGLRFVTRSPYDSYRVIQFLHQNSLVSFPNSICDQVTNSLYPLNLFLEAMDELRSRGPSATAEEIQAALDKKWHKESDRGELVAKENKFSGEGYKFMKFISRHLVRIPLEGQKPLRFFYPFEVQIMDYQTYLSNLQGEMSHSQYKDRQKRAARLRVFGFLENKS